MEFEAMYGVGELVSVDPDVAPEHLWEGYRVVGCAGTSQVRTMIGEPAGHLTAVSLIRGVMRR